MKTRAVLCVNGCKAATQPPSKVLCKTCLDKLNAKIQMLLGGKRP